MKRRPPTWNERYKLGVALSKQLDPVCTYQQIGADLGITHQNAYHETMLALGTLAWRLSDRFGAQLNYTQVRELNYAQARWLC